MRRARLLAAEGKWGKTPLRFRLLGFKVSERTPQRLTLQLPFWLRGREAQVAKVIRNTERDAELAELDIKIEVGHRLLKITRGGVCAMCRHSREAHRPVLREMANGTWCKKRGCSCQEYVPPPNGRK